MLGPSGGSGFGGGAHTSVLFSASLWREVEYVSFPHYKQCFNQGSFPSSPGAHVVSPKQAQDIGHKDRSVIGSSHPGLPESGVGVGPIPASCGEWGNEGPVSEGQQCACRVGLLSGWLCKPGRASVRESLETPHNPPSSCSERPLSRAGVGGGRQWFWRPRVSVAPGGVPCSWKPGQPPREAERLGAG